MEKEELILQILKEIKEELRDMKAECKDRGTSCNGRIKCLEDFKTKYDAVKDQTKDGLSFWALLIACISGLLTIIINFDKVIAAIK